MTNDRTQATALAKTPADRVRALAGSYRDQKNITARLQYAEKPSA